MAEDRRRKPVVRTCWGTIRSPRHGWPIPCLWVTFREAVENCDEDERVVRVRVEWTEVKPRTK